MDYKMEELLPLVKELAEVYTGKESSSITYETAQKLMEAVLYCIRENDRPLEEQYGEAFVSVDSFPSARAAYDMGYRLVVEKTRKANEIYNELIPVFQAYGNRAYYETVVKGIPEFFRWYNPSLEPMNHILTMDYPVLEPLHKLEGIDLIYRFLQCVQLEQRFLNKFPEAYIRRLLIRYHSNYEELLLNLCGVILKRVLANMLIGKRLDQDLYTSSDYEKLTEHLSDSSKEELLEELYEHLNRLITEVYSGDRSLYSYLVKEVPNIATELRNAVCHHNLEHIL